MTAALRVMLLLSLLLAVPASAQRSTAPCPYDECALRIKSATFTAPPALVRGLQDEQLARLGLFQAPITQYMLRSDSAAVYARKYDDTYDTGGVLTIVGTVLSIASPIIFRGTVRKILWTTAGIGISVYGGIITNRANDHLARAIWWHNRELTPGGRRP